MILYRFTSHKYKDDLSGTGAKLYGGRWNSVGTAALYTSTTISLSLLEVLVNAQTIEQLQSLSLMRIEIPDAIETSNQDLLNLKKNWHLDFDYTQFIGSKFLQNSNYLMLKCPSAVIHDEMNYLLNPLHKDYNKIKLLKSSDFQFDERLFKVQV